jgi:integrase
MPRLTVNFINTKVTAPPSGQVIYRDDALPGFALRVTPGSMSYIAECRVNGNVRRVTIGRHGVLTPEEARKQARVILGKMAAGQDPAAEKSNHRATSLTLGQAFEEYMAGRDMRPSTVYNFNRIMRKDLGDWFDKPVVKITRDMVEERYRKIGSGSQLGTSGKASANLTMQVLQATLNYISYKYEVDGEPLLPVNPVARLRDMRIWYKVPQRQGVIPDHKLADWYQAVMSLGNQTARDYYLALILTGLRRNELPRVLWSDICLESRVLTLRAELNKSAREHRLPLTDFLMEIFQRRYAERGESEFVFAGRNGRGRYWGGYHTIETIREKSGCHFVIHDLRRVFLTMAERLDTPHYALKKLAGHSMREDLTAGYLVIDVERLRLPMQRVTDRLLELMGVAVECKAQDGPALIEQVQAVAIVETELEEVYW